MGLSLIALGGNMGDVQRCFSAARDALHALPDSRVTASSRLYVTSPLGPPAQADYLNAAIALDAELAPEALLTHMQQIEDRHGRVRNIHWGPRTLDLDLIAYDDMRMDTPRLTLPHPHMHERMFVLQPVCDIAPEWRHPRLGKTAAELLEELMHAGIPGLRGGRSW